MDGVRDEEEASLRADASHATFASRVTPTADPPRLARLGQFERVDCVRRAPGIGSRLANASWALLSFAVNPETFVYDAETTKPSVADINKQHRDIFF